MTTRPFPVDQIADEVAQTRAFAESVAVLRAAYPEQGLGDTEAVAFLDSLHEALMQFVDAPTDLAVRAEGERLGSLFVDLAAESGVKI